MGKEFRHEKEFLCDDYAFLSTIHTLGGCVFGPGQRGTAHFCNCKLDINKLEPLTGVKGELIEKEGVLKVTVSRSDLKIIVAGVKMTPPMGLA